jgi:multimeric flavodoxin WrbA
MVSALLKGAEEAGAETEQVFLAEKDIRYCRGCHSCWKETLGKCVIQDDMAGVLSLVAGASIFVLATPVYFGNVSGTLKVFMDRLTVIGSPHTQKSGAETGPNAATSERRTPKLLMISNCGLSDRSQFQVVSLWINRVAAMMQTDLTGEIYAPQGRFLTAATDELRPALTDYLTLLENAGKELSAGMRLSERTAQLLKQSPCWELRAGSTTRAG